MCVWSPALVLLVGNSWSYQYIEKLEKLPESGSIMNVILCGESALAA